MNALPDRPDQGAQRVPMLYPAELAPARPLPAETQVGALCRHPGSGKVLLITSRGTGRWIIPKGWPMRDRSNPAAAMQEAWEEAGARGEIGSAECGRYAYDKALDNGGAIPVEVRVYLAWVETLAKDFPEAGQRRRRWFSPEKAAALVDEEGLRRILRDLPAAGRKKADRKKKAKARK